MAEMEKKDIVRLMVIVGGIIGLLQAIAGFGNFRAWIYPIGYIVPLFALNAISSVIGLIIAILTLLSVFRPDNPIPYSAVVLIIFGVLMIFFNAVTGGIIVLIAGILWLAWKL
ncbi:MAG: hypothetical protein ACW96S_12600 [Promethearchaeota archaeon]|jgi:type III secretory pathway component EscS